MRKISIVISRWALLISVVVGAGCGGPERERPETKRDLSSIAFTLSAIQAIVAKQLGKEPASIDPESTFGALGADDLDLVEIVMEVEDELKILIPDEALHDAAGFSDSGRNKLDNLCRQLTVRAFATVAERAKKLEPSSQPNE